MSDNGNYYDMIAMQQMAMPEWVGGASKNAHYAPPDVGSQASQLNYIQDLMGTGVNPLMMWLSGQMNNGMLASTYEPAAGGRLDGTDEIIREANTAGTDYLMNVMQTSPDSVEGMIAEHILAGGSPVEAVQLAEQKGLIPKAMKDSYANGQKVGQEPDTTMRDYYMKWATDAANKRLADTPEQRQPAKEVLHPFVQSMIDAGFEDPRKQYTPEVVNPALGGMAQDVVGAGTDRASALANYKAMAGRVKDPAEVERAQGMLGMFKDLMNPSGRPMKAITDANGAPISQSMGPQLDLGGGGFNLPSRTFIPQIPTERRMTFAEATADRRKNHTPYDPKPAQAAKKKAFDEYRAAETRSAGANKKLVQERAKARAVSNHLQAQGRSPALDQYQAAMQSLLSRFGG